MKKSVTIPKIEEDLYCCIKLKAEENNKSVSEYVSSLFEQELNEDLSTKNKEIENLNEEIISKNEEIISLRTEIENITYSKDSIIEELKKRLQATEEEINNLLKINPNEIKVYFDDLEAKLIYYVAEKESKRTGKNVTPADLLRAMFVNYSVKGEMWFFTQPTRKEINQLKEELKTEENE